jgi:hypothetical protein
MYIAMHLDLIASSLKDILFVFPCPDPFFSDEPMKLNLCEVMEIKIMASL